MISQTNNNLLLFNELIPITSINIYTSQGLIHN